MAVWLAQDFACQALAGLVALIVPPSSVVTLSILCKCVSIS
jgi:hypothetical protein